MNNQQEQYSDYKYQRTKMKDLLSVWLPRKCNCLLYTRVYAIKYCLTCYSTQILYSEIRILLGRDKAIYSGCRDLISMIL